MRSLAYHCYAKVNLTLEVLARRADGFHDLASVVHTVSLADDLRIDAAEELDSHCQGLDLDPESNLVTRAARLLAATAGVRAGAELTLLKRIPAAAGLGGGSSDAAAALVGLDWLWKTRLDPARLSDLAGRLGSDVPFFLRGGAAILRGRGDELEALPPLDDQWLTIVVQPHSVTDKTRRLYAALEPADFSPGEATQRVAECLRQHQPIEPTDLINSFERAARVSFGGLSRAWAAVEQHCQRAFFLSGAGPALFCLARDRADAMRQQALLSRLGWLAYAVKTVPNARAALDPTPDTPIGYP